MKCLIVLCAVVAVSVAKPGYLAGGVAGLAGHLGYAAAPAVYGHGYAYHGPQHLPAITAAGVPVDTPDVQAARAAHAVAYSHAATAAGAGHGVAAYGAPLAAAAALSGHGVVAPGVAAYGAPLAAAAALSGHGVVAPGVAAYGGALAAHGVVAPGVAAYGAPLAAAAAYGGYGHAAVAPYAHGYAYHGPQHVPVLTPAGVPVDTPEVQAARAADAVAHLNAKAHHG